MTDLQTFFSELQCSPSDAEAKMSFHLKQKKNAIPLNKSPWEEKGKKLLLLLFGNSNLELWILVRRVAPKH